MTSFIPSVVGLDSGDSDRRADPRKALRANAAFVFEGRALEVRTLDISTSGMGVATSINPRIGQTLSILVARPEAPRGPARIAMQVTVVHSVLTRAEGEFKVGLRFGALSREALDIVKRYMAG